MSSLRMRRSRCFERLDDEESDEPWLTVCSFLNPHDIAIFGVIALTQGLRYDTGNIPEIADAPTHDEDLFDQARLSAELRRCLGEDVRPAAVD